MKGLLSLICFSHIVHANNLSAVSIPSLSTIDKNKTPVVITLGQIKTSEIQQQVFEFLTPIYRELGIELKVKSLPSKRALAFSNKGLLDGELLRVEGIEGTYTNLVPVPITLYQMSTYAYTIKGKRKFKKPTEILHFKIGIHRGVHWEETFVSQFPHCVSRVGGTRIKFKLLALGRVDYVLSSEQRANQVIAKYFPNDDIVRVSPIIKKINLIHYLHQKHAHLIPSLLRALKQQQNVLPLAHAK
ncbi:MAG: hypothetical protein HRU25_09350 [Psychrobium sp.]|nr:hypothetical protein [Psychrobium sp.]